MHNSIAQRRNAKVPDLTVLLWDSFLSDGRRAVCPGPDFLVDTLQEIRHANPLFHGVPSHPIYACCSGPFVGTNVLPGGPECTAVVDEVEDIVEPKGPIPCCPLVKLRLPRKYPVPWFTRIHP